VLCCRFARRPAVARYQPAPKPEEGEQSARRIGGKLSKIVVSPSFSRNLFFEFESGVDYTPNSPLTGSLMHRFAPRSAPRPRKLSMFCPTYANEHAANPALNLKRLSSLLCLLDHFRAHRLFCAKLLCGKFMSTGAASPLCVCASHDRAAPGIFAGPDRHHQLTTAFEALSLNRNYLHTAGGCVLLVRIEYCATLLALAVPPSFPYQGSMAGLTDEQYDSRNKHRDKRVAAHSSDPRMHHTFCISGLWI